MDLNISALRKASDITHLLYHRNQNQHRHSQWWKWLSMLKRCLLKLIDELECDRVARSEARLYYMKDHLIPRCYVSFTQVIQDGQFSALGLVLVAELAKVCRLIRFTGKVVEDLGAEPMRGVREAPVEAPPRVPDEVGEAVARMPEAKNSPKPEPNAMVDAAAIEKDTVGSSVTSLVDTSGGQTEIEPKAPPRVTSSHKRISGKVKKGSNVIDDLFRGLD